MSFSNVRLFQPGCEKALLALISCSFPVLLLRSCSPSLSKQETRKPLSTLLVVYLELEPSQRSMTQFLGAACSRVLFLQKTSIVDV